MKTFHLNLDRILLLLSLFLGLVAKNDSASIAGNLTSHAQDEDHEQIKPTTGMAFSIDLILCQCLDLSVDCELVIVKSNLMEIGCLETQQFCCNSKQQVSENPKHADTDTESDKSKGNDGEMVSVTSTGPNSNQDSKETKTANHIRMRISTVGDLITANEDNIPNITPITASTEEQQQPPIKCRCKPRLNCSTEYIDYSFGFHCSYDKVRCCEPYELYQKEMEQQHGGRLVILGEFDSGLITPDDGTDQEGHDGMINSFESNNEEEYVNNCLCVPESECNMKNTNEITKRRDMACPFNYIQCCGSSLIVNKSDYFAVDKSYNSEDIIPSEEQQINGRGMAPNLIDGQSRSRQKPVQLPEPMVPLESEPTPSTGRDLFDSGPFPAPAPANTDPAAAISTIAPPILPNYYNPNQDKGNENGQIYYQQAVRRPIQQTQPYFTGRIVDIPSPGSSSQVLYRIPGSNTYYAFKNNQNGHQGSINNKYNTPTKAGWADMSSGRSNANDSVFSSIWNLFSG